MATWDEPTETPVDYRLAWARDDESFKTWTDLTGNAFPITNTQVITGLNGGVRYKVKVRARYQGTGDGPARRLERGGAGGRYVCADSDADGHADPDGDTHFHIDTDSHIDTYAHTDPDGHADGDSYGHADGDSD